MLLHCHFMGLLISDLFSCTSCLRKGLSTEFVGLKVARWKQTFIYLVNTISRLLSQYFPRSRFPLFPRELSGKYFLGVKTLNCEARAFSLQFSHFSCKQIKSVVIEFNWKTAEFDLKLWLSRVGPDRTFFDFRDSKPVADLEIFWV